MQHGFGADAANDSAMVVALSRRSGCTITTAGRSADPAAIDANSPMGNHGSDGRGAVPREIAVTHGNHCHGYGRTVWPQRETRGRAQQCLVSRGPRRVAKGAAPRQRRGLPLAALSGTRWCCFAWQSGHQARQPVRAMRVMRPTRRFRCPTARAAMTRLRESAGACRLPSQPARRSADRANTQPWVLTRTHVPNISSMPCVLQLLCFGAYLREFA